MIWKFLILPPLMVQVDRGAATNEVHCIDYFIFFKELFEIAKGKMWVNSVTLPEVL